VLCVRREDVHTLKYRIRIERKSEIVNVTPDSTLAIVLTTVAADAHAAALARTLVDERLAACVNVLPPMTSFYRWKGVVEEDREQQLVIKTTSDRTAALEARLRELHPYALPEFVVLDANASHTYGAWVGESVGSG
jgi:periplasmic divalent cation tolerance protein